MRRDHLWFVAKTFSTLKRFGLRYHDRNCEDAVSGLIEYRSGETRHGRILVKEYFGMTVTQTFKTWTVCETNISVTALALAFTLGLGLSMVI
jgi:hypothetical protein